MDRFETATSQTIERRASPLWVQCLKWSLTLGLLFMLVHSVISTVSPRAAKTIEVRHLIPRSGIYDPIRVFDSRHEKFYLPDGSLSDQTTGRKVKLACCLAGSSRESDLAIELPSMTFQVWDANDTLLRFGSQSISVEDVSLWLAAASSNPRVTPKVEEASEFVEIFRYLAKGGELHDVPRDIHLEHLQCRMSPTVLYATSGDPHFASWEIPAWLLVWSIGIAWFHRRRWPPTAGNSHEQPQVHGTRIATRSISPLFLRLLASIIDINVVYLAGAVLAGILQGSLFSSIATRPASEQHLLQSLLLAFEFGVPVLVLWVVPAGCGRSTIGQRVYGIRSVRYPSLQPMGVARSCAVTVAAIVTFPVTCALTCIRSLGSHQNRRPLWYDELTGTAVVDIARSPWHAPSHCANCGYDLRGSTESLRCPECGTIIDRCCPNRVDSDYRQLSTVPRDNG